MRKSRKKYDYIIAVDGHWVGKWVDTGVGKLRAFGVKCYTSKKKAVRSASHRKFKGTISVSRSWGVGPKQRKVIWRKRR